MAEDKGSLSERWQMRQEMVAHGIQVGWRLPTREDFEHFNDARNLKDDMDTALPWEVTRISLPQMMQSIYYVTPDEQARIHDLTMKEDRTQPERLELIALWSKVAPVVEVVREEVQAFNQGYHLWNPVNLTDAQVQALEDHAALKQQEMFQPNQLPLGRVLEDTTPFRQVVDRMAEQTQEPFKPLTQVDVYYLNGREDYLLGRTHNLAQVFFNREKQQIDQWYAKTMDRLETGVGEVVREQMKPHAWIAAEAARLRAEQGSAEVVKEVAKKDYSIGF